MAELNTYTTHDLWVEGRQFELAISRPTPTTIQLTVTRPTGQLLTTGAVLTVSTIAIGPEMFPIDSMPYQNPSLNLAAPGDMIGSAQVVGSWASQLGTPFPAWTVTGTKESFSVTVTGADPATVYYASVHSASNVQQYYTLGIQSYPLEAVENSRRQPTSYAGSIPTLPSAPLAPTPGMVYFDQQLNLVQYWDSARSVWVPTRTDQIISGPTNPGMIGQAYFLSTSQKLRIFDGLNWQDATPANLQVRIPGPNWAPMTAQVKANISLPTTPAVGDFFYDYTSQRIQYWDGALWQIPTPSSTLFNTGSSVVPAFTTAFSIEGVDLVTPYIGLLFYNTADAQLNVWNGTNWIQANTDQQGVSTSDKIGIGNDGTYDERMRLIKILKTQLGWPTQCVELTEEAFNVAIDNALDTYRQLCIGAYEQRFFVFPLMKDQATYFLNSPMDRTDSVVSVMHVWRLNLFGVTGGGPDNTWGQAFAQQFYNYTGVGMDLLSVHLVHSWSDEFQRIFAGDMPFTWNEARRELTLKRFPRQNERVVLEVELERSEQELLQDRWCKQFLQNWALAECKEYLGMIRSKYSSGTPGAAGTITLNGETLLAEARQDFTELKQALLDYEYQNAEHGNVAFLMA